MMCFRVELELGNDAMKTTRDVAQILVKVQAGLISSAIKPLVGKTKIRDDNGNTVGHFEFYEPTLDDPGNDDQ